MNKASDIVQMLGWDPYYPTRGLPSWMTKAQATKLFLDHSWDKHVKVY